MSNKNASDSRLSYWVPQRGEDSKNDEGSFVFFNKVDVKDAPGLLALDKKLTIEAFEKVKGKYTSFSLPIDALIREVNQLTATNLQELNNCRLQIQKYQKVLNEVVAFYSAWKRLKKSEEVLGVHETELGKLNSAKYQEAKNMYEALMEKSSVTFAELEEYQLANKVIADAVLNSPTDGMLLQIQPDFHATGNHSMNSRIVGSAKKVPAIVLRTDAAELNSIFYFKSGKLLCLGTGTSLKASGMEIQTGYYEAGDLVEFGTTGLYKYNVKVGNLYLKADANDGTGEGGATNAREVHDEEGWSHFILHKVTSIPVRIGSTGYATLCLPVAVQVDGNYETFAARKKEGNSLELIPLAGVIPANTAFIIKGEPSTDSKSSICQLAVKEGGSPVQDNVLKGFTDYSQQSTVSGTVYALTKNTEGSAVFGLLSGILPVPFRAFYTESSNNPGVRELNLHINSTLTSVQQLQNPPFTGELFDLSGRRVKMPMRGGIYLQNGKKIIAQ